MTLADGTDVTARNRHSRRLFTIAVVDGGPKAAPLLRMLNGVENVTVAVDESRVPVNVPVVVVTP